MAAKKKDALAVKGNSAIMNWDDELMKEAQEASAKEKAPGSFISFKAGQISLGGAAVPGNKVEVIVVDNIFENVYYAGKYDPDEPKPPTCYAFGRDEEELSPHDKSHEKQHDQCKGCPLNEYGSADQGKGKACKNTRRLAIISTNGLDAAAIADAEVYYAKLPVTSTKNWAFYVKGVAANYNRPPWAMKTEMSTQPDPKSQFKVVFRPTDPVDNKVLGALKTKREEVMQAIEFPYGDMPEEKQEQPKGKKKFAK